MNIIDPTTPVGKIRLRIGDWQDTPILNDSVIESALEDCKNHVPRAAALCAQYVLATLTAKTHRKISNLETWSNEQFTNYIKFLQTTLLNPHLMDVSPLSYGGASAEIHPFIVFSDEWNSAYCPNAGTF